MTTQRRRRIAKAERSVIERGLDRDESARKIANGLGPPPRRSAPRSKPTGRLVLDLPRFRCQRNRDRFRCRVLRTGWH